MSLYTSQSGEAWNLKAAVDALAHSARRAGRPGMIWLAGLLYPSFTLIFGWEFAFTSFRGYATDSPRGLEVRMPGEIELVGPEEVLILGSLLLLVALPFFRMVVGLAGVSAHNVRPENAEAPPPKLGEVWQSGKGLTLSSCGLYIQIILMFVFAFLLCAGPAFLAMEMLSIDDSEVQVFMASPVLLLLAIYGAVLSILYQLSLHSLARNRRGVASALIHAWRLVRRDPWATARTMLVDALLFFSVTVLTQILITISAITCFGPIVVWIVLHGFMGVARAGYWAQAYRALGGLSPEDGVPGLEPHEAAG